MHHSKVPSVHQGQSKFIIAFWYHPWKLLDQVKTMKLQICWLSASKRVLAVTGKPFLPFHLHCFSIWRLIFFDWTTCTCLAVAEPKHTGYLFSARRDGVRADEDLHPAHPSLPPSQRSSLGFRGLGQFLLLYTCCRSRHTQFCWFYTTTEEHRGTKLCVQLWSLCLLRVL